MSLRLELQSIAEQKRKVLVAGLGVSGIETAKFLLRVGIAPVCVEKTHPDDYATLTKYQDEIAQLKEAGGEIHFGVDGEGIAPFLNEVALCVVSPGISPESSLCGALRRHSIPIVTELELGIELLGSKVVAVTGSNGKTTSVTLIHEILTAGGVPARLCGNVGTPVVCALDSESLKHQPAFAEVLVVEASSYQLEWCHHLKPFISVILNISENHLERHGSIERYLGAKSKIFSQQDSSDFALINSDDSRLSGLVGNLKAKLLMFGQKVGPNTQGSAIKYEPSAGLDEILLRIGDNTEKYFAAKAKLIGLHNRYDIAASILVCRLLGVEQSVIQKKIIEFIPLEHRFELVADVSGVTYINDSKSTTVASAVAAVSTWNRAFPNSRLTLMIGGQAKAGSWLPLMSQLKEYSSRIAPVICFGGDGNLLASHCRAANIPATLAPKLSDAVEIARKSAQPTDVVLLSPGCASFDEFSNFEERGNMFKSLVLGHS